MKKSSIFVALLFLFSFDLFAAEWPPIAFTDYKSMKAYFANEGIAADIKVVTGSPGKERVIHVKIGSKKYVFVDPNKSGYRGDWGKAYNMKKAPKGYNIDHVFGKARGRDRFKFVMLQAVQKDVNQQVGRIWEQRTARMSKTQLSQLKTNLDRDVARGYRKAGPMERIKLDAVHGTPEHKIRVPISDPDVSMKTLSIKEFRQRHFIQVSGQVLRGSGIVLGTAMIGQNIIDALKGFYTSPTVALTKAHLEDGKYALARRTFESQCVNHITSKPECEHLRKAISESSTILQARIWMDFPEFAMMLYENWEEEARQIQQTNNDIAAALEPTPRPRPPNPMPYKDIPENAYLSFKTEQSPAATIYKGQVASTRSRVMALVDGYWVRVSAAPVFLSINGSPPKTFKTDDSGIISFRARVANRPFRNVLTLKIEKQNAKREYFVRTYDYVVEQDGEFPVGWANGKDAVTMSLKLQKRFVSANGDLILREPHGYENDFETVAFQPKWQGQPSQLKLGLSTQAMDKVVIAQPDLKTGKISILVTSPDEGKFSIGADLRGGLFFSRLLKAGEFDVTFKGTPSGLRLRWADSMRPLPVEGHVVFPAIPKGAPKRLEMRVIAERELNGKTVPVAGISIQFSIEPSGHAVVRGLPAITTDEGLAKMADSLPFVTTPKAGRGVITITADGATNSLEAEVTGKVENVLLPPGWVRGYLYNSNDGNCDTSGKPMIFSNFRGHFTTLPELSIEKKVIVLPGRRREVAIESRTTMIRAFTSSSATDTNAALSRIAFGTLDNSANGWWFASGCAKGSRPPKQCDNGRGQEGNCKEL